MDEVALLLDPILALNADNVFQDLDVQVIGIQPRHERRKNVGFLLLPNVNSESAFAILHGTAGHLTIWIRVQIEGHGQYLLGYVV
jgi:hypothetical protein